MRRGHSSMLTALVAVAACAGCGAGPSSGPAPAIMTVPSGPASSATAPAAATPDGPVGGAAPTHPAAATTVPAVAPPEPVAGLESAFLALQDTAYQCLTDVATCSPDTVALPGSPAAAMFGALVEHLRSNGFEVVLRPESSSDTVLASELGADGRSARVVDCNVDGHWVVDPSTAGTLGHPTVVNDLVVTRRYSYELRLTEDGWRRWDFSVEQQWPGEHSCAD